MTSSKFLLTNSIANFAGYSVTILLNVISYPIIINKIGISSVGIYALMMAILAPMDVANFGFSEATIRFVAYYNNLHDKQMIREYLSTTFFMNLLVGILGMAIIALAGPPIAYSLFDFKSESYETIKFCFLLVGVGWIVRQLTTFWLSIPSAFEKFKLIAVGNLSTSVVTTASILLFVFQQPNLKGYVWGTLCGATLSLVLWVLLVHLANPEISFSVKPSKRAWLSSFNYGGWRTISSVGALLTNQTDKYFLGIYLPASASGVYNTILQVQQKILSGVWKFAEVLFPAFSANLDTERHRKLDSFLKANYLITAVSIIFFCPLVILSTPVLKLWIGDEFALLGSMTLKCLSYVGILASVTVTQILFLNANGLTKQTAFSTYYTGITTLVGAIIFIPSYGLNGVGYGVLFAAISRIPLFHYYLKKYFDAAFDWKDYYAASAYPVVVTAAVAGLFGVVVDFRPTNFFELTVDYLITLVSILSTLVLANILLPSAKKFNILITDVLAKAVKLFEIKND